MCDPKNMQSLYDDYGTLARAARALLEAEIIRIQNKDCGLSDEWVALADALGDLPDALRLVAEAAK